MQFRCTFMEISSIPNYLVYSIKRLPTPKVNKLPSPKLRFTQSLMVATFTQNFMRFRCMVMVVSSIQNYLVYSIKRLPTAKVNMLQSPKLRLTQSLLVATLTQNFMRFRCTVMEKRHQNFPPHSRLVCVCHPLHCHSIRMPNLRILLVNTKVPRSTKKMVAGVRERYDKVSIALVVLVTGFARLDV